MLRKFVNVPSLAVDEMIEGFVGTYPALYDPVEGAPAMVYKNRRKNRVSLVIGGGSGHEPMFLGFVGNGLADAAVCGRLFQSPKPEQICKAAEYVDNGKGVILLFGNYPGNKSNSSEASKMLEERGIQSGLVIVHDDISSAPASQKESRRGIAGDVLMIRMIGAACDAGMELEDILQLAGNINDHLWSIGVAIPNHWRKKSYLYGVDSSATNIEYGVGLQGEVGLLQTELQPVDHLVDKIYNQLMEEILPDNGKKVCVLVNGFSYVSMMELAIISRRVQQLLNRDAFTILDIDFNNYCAGYNPDGFSLTILQVLPEWERLAGKPYYSPFYYRKDIDSPKLTESETLSPDAKKRTIGKKTSIIGQQNSKKQVRITNRIPGIQGNEMDVHDIRDMMIYVAHQLIDEEPLLSRLDSINGDGDHGICIENGMLKALEHLEGIGEGSLPGDIFQIMGKTMLLSAGGTTGVLFGNMFLALSEGLGKKKTVTTSEFGQMWKGSLRVVKERGGARRGEKTIIDALEPAVTELEKAAGEPFAMALEKAQSAAETGVEKTKQMAGKYSRGNVALEQTSGVQDAGATTVWIMFRSMWEFCKGEKKE